MVKPLITIQSPLLTSLMLVSHCGEYVANGLTSAIRHQFVMIANDRQTFVDVRKHSRSLMRCYIYQVYSVDFSGPASYQQQSDLQFIRWWPTLSVHKT